MWLDEEKNSAAACAATDVIPEKITTFLSRLSDLGEFRTVTSP
jgi:hypothetical protein